jgi:hypothetical protein
MNVPPRELLRLQNFKKRPTPLGLLLPDSAEMYARPSAQEITVDTLSTERMISLFTFGREPSMQSSAPRSSDPIRVAISLTLRRIAFFVVAVLFHAFTMGSAHAHDLHNDNALVVSDSPGLLVLGGSLVLVSFLLKKGLRRWS